MIIKEKVYLLLIFFSALFFSGCIFDKKNADIDNEILPFSFISAPYSESISQDQASLLGFIFLPFFLEQSIGKKNENFYIVDNFYKASIEAFDSSYQLLKTLYIQDGWAFIEEVFSNMYIHAFFKKEGKEMVVFVQEKEIYDVQNKTKSKQILLHQSLLLV